MGLNRSGLLILLLVVVLLIASLISQADSIQTRHLAKTDNWYADYYDHAVTAARYGFSFSLLVGLATLQSVLYQKTGDSRILGNTVNYVFMPLTLSVSLYTLTPLQSKIGKFIHGLFAQPEKSETIEQPTDDLEALWFRTYQSYSMNAQMSRNVVLAFNTMTFLYLERIQSQLLENQLETALKTQALFFQAVGKYFSEISCTSKIWQDIFIPHARLLWQPYRNTITRGQLPETFPMQAKELFVRDILDGE